MATQTATQAGLVMGVMGVRVVITLAKEADPSGRVAEAELHFDGDGILAGLKLIGFSVWARRGGAGYNVTFPARQYSVNGERRSFALLRPTGNGGFETGQLTASEALRDAIVEAYRQTVKALLDGERAQSVE